MSLIGFKAQNHPQQPKKDQVDDRGTDPEFFARMVERFGPFTVDVAAAAHNAKCERYYTIDDDGLAQSWAGERVWCNPPYSDIGAWVRKAWDERLMPGTAPLPELIVMLLPANRTEQRWWQDHVELARMHGSLRVEFLPGRMRFVRPGADSIGPNERPPFGCCLLIWQREVCR